MGEHANEVVEQTGEEQARSPETVYPIALDPNNLLNPYVGPTTIRTCRLNYLLLCFENDGMQPGVRDQVAIESPTGIGQPWRAGPVVVSNGAESNPFVMAPDGDDDE